MKVYKISIDEDDRLGMSCISFVDEPAVEEDFLTFKKEGEHQLKLQNIDEERRIVTGVVAVADMPILRFNEEIGYHYVIFDKDTIQKMVERYFSKGYQNNVNLQHEGNLVEGVTMYESYIKNTERGISPVEFSDLADGSWLVSYKVENDDLWKEIKEGKTLKGFSLEGYFCYSDEVKEIDDQDEYSKWIEDILN